MASDWLQGKSPKQWINEICVKQLRQPEWETREARPGQQPPTFISRCKIIYADATLETEGSGKTKREAEQAAALEMLVKLDMTPIKLQNLINCSKTKSKSSTGSSGSVADDTTGDDASVSDTDQKEMLSAPMNPVSELLGLCDKNGLDDPEFEEVKEEGPPHKKIFTVRCTVKKLGISFSGRRQTKKMAKRLAAFRVLKEIKSRGLKYILHADSDNGKKAIDELDNEKPLSENMKGLLSENNIILSYENVERFKSVGIQCSELLDKNDLPTGHRIYCSDESEKCVKFCVNYSHAFHHLKKSETMDKILAMPSSDGYKEFGGPIATLQKVSSEMGIKIRLIKDEVDIGSTVETLMVIMLKFPFSFKLKVPHLAAVHAIENDEEVAKRVAAEKAIEFLRYNFLSSDTDGQISN